MKKEKKNKKSKSPRDDVENRDEFIKRAEKELSIEIRKDKNNGEPLGYYRNKFLFRAAPRSGYLFGLYRKHDDSKFHPIKIITKDDMEKEFNILKGQIEEIDEKVTRPIIKKKSKSNSYIIEELNERLERAKAGHEIGFSLKGIKVDTQVIDWVEQQGFRLSTNTVYFE